MPLDLKLIYPIELIMMLFSFKKLKIILPVLALLFLASCYTKGRSDSIDTNRLSVPDSITNNGNQSGDMSNQIGEYVVETFEASNGDLWFGTLSKGAARYNMKELKYFTINDGLPSNRVTCIVEDSIGNLWFGTGNGLAKFDGKKFTDYSIKDGLIGNLISNLFIDSKGIIWIGTWSGVCHFNGENFVHFPIPYPNVETPINEDTKDWITEIREDSEGNIWFGRDGYGVCRYDGVSFTHYLRKNGLHSNNVTAIEIDMKGRFWIGTRVSEKDNPDPQKRIGKGGVNRYDGIRVESFPEIVEFNHGDVYEIYRDQLGAIWIGTTNNGVYKYDGKEFKNFDVPVSIMDIMKDRKGNLWLGGAGGLYRINSKGEVLNVAISGPWK